MGAVGYLLDTHTLLWALRDSPKLGCKTKQVIENSDFPIYVSAVSAYEITNKYRLNKLDEYKDIVMKYSQALQDFGAVEIPVSSWQAQFAGRFKWAHRDPFDRILAAQAYLGDMTLLTNDPAFNGLP